MYLTAHSDLNPDLSRAGLSRVTCCVTCQREKSRISPKPRELKHWGNSSQSRQVPRKAWVGLRQLWFERKY